VNFEVEKPRIAKENSKILRRTKKEIFLIVDGPSLDRACRRLGKRIDLQNLISVSCTGNSPLISRYYTLIPNEDDSRQRAFLSAIENLGLEVIIKRLPPKGVNKQINLDAEMSTDMTLFALGQLKFLNQEERVGSTTQHMLKQSVKLDRFSESQVDLDLNAPNSENIDNTQSNKCIILVCPSRDLLYTFNLVKNLQCEIVCVDFGRSSNSEINSIFSNNIDLSRSESVWLKQ
jgi:hypothetical protein